MKYIVSTTGKKIEFSLSGTRHLVIEPTIAIQVEESELNTLIKRLGGQIKEIQMDTTTEPTQAPQEAPPVTTPATEATPATTAESTVETPTVPQESAETTTA